MRTWTCWFLLPPVMLTVAGLATGANWLARPTPGWSQLPLGNLATWVSLVCLSLLLINRGHGTALWKKFAGLAIALSLGWGFVGYFLSGNWRNSFQGDDAAFLFWITYTVSVVVLLLGGMLILLASRLRPRHNRA